ncbi:hypothetical protein HNQ93_002999 [Hymenobacter luteus]|uniref:Outer membrane protein beta-barrel domain-containing protein n=2 Tax=Hymenobacter TaxID=89966 RepID=A0A7W9T2Z6_9BACT|nr:MULTISPECIES: hypothetical protein [Hymenobacter]MBB4603235.1 hypothetical protein [Hymenobacter latericoloratus]MBB6060133.1 hypothetical protein [Hymenobacter luteus]
MFLTYFAWMVLTTAVHGQSKLYLDLKAGANYTFAEGAYFGKGTRPFKAYSSLSFDEQGVAMLRLQVRENWGISAGYSGSTLGWAYSLKVPDKYTVNPFEGERRGHSTGRYMHQFPLLFSKRISEYNIKEIDTVRHTYLASFRLDIVLGSGLNWNTRNCSGCGQLNSGSLAYDTIDFSQRIINKQSFGTFIIGGITARFYRLNKERLNLSIYYTQGLTDMLLVPVEYRYNSQRGSTTLHVRGSGFSATLGVPIRLKTFKNAVVRGGG